MSTKSMSLPLAIASAALTLVGPALAQPAAKTTKDLCVGPCAPDWSNVAKPGVKVFVTLERNGGLQQVSPTHRFKKGDKIRLVLETNSDAYVVVTNEGPTGKKTLLFPQAGQSGHVAARKNATIPPAGSVPWHFDNTPGVEKLIVVMSARPIAEIGQISSGSQGGTGGHAGPANPDAEASILAQLNSRALEATQETFGKDLCVGPCEGGTGYLRPNDPWYVLTNAVAMQGKVAFTVLLNHD